MNAFGMAGTENAKKFSDVLAKAATSSSTNVAQLGRALEACQGTAGNLGYAIEDVNGKNDYEDGYVEDSGGDDGGDDGPVVEPGEGGTDR